MKSGFSISNRRAVVGVCFALVVMVWFVFGQSLSFDFVNYDDGQYVYGNSFISGGLTSEGLHQIATQPHSANWHPLTSLTHMLDCQIYDLVPAGHRLTNILLHMATAISLFLVLRSMTGSLWRSAFVAALFAVHPLRVESVVWISERKDVLSGLFFMLTLGAYTRYARVAGGGWRVTGRYYLAVVLFFVLGLLSKSMLVTLPFVLLLVDWHRAWGVEHGADGAGSPGWWWRRFVEKIPLFLLSALFCGIAIWAQGLAIASVEVMSIPWRIGNALLSYVTYMKQMILPTGLAVLYPAHREALSLWSVGFSLILLAGITTVVLRERQKRPYLLTGWFWYLGMLVPVIGIMQVGGQAHADRYTYLPQIGLGILIAWLAGDWAVSGRRRKLAAVMAALTLVGLMLAARVQVGYWRDSVSLWSRALACTTNNYVAHSNLGAALFVNGNTSAAIDHFEQALRINPRQAETFNNLASAYADEGRYPEAVAAARLALRLAKSQNPAVVEAIRTRLLEYQTHLSKGVSP
ncbi:MAG: tetratricopeptide repeat protein [Kiritimatiellales bacterium]